MREFLRRFRIPLIIIAVMFLIVFILYVVRTSEEITTYVRENTECLTEERVFDYADVLTPTEEQDLRLLIAKREAQVGVDIVLVTINEPSEQLLSEMPYDDFEVGAYGDITMAYADNFYDQQMFGYNKPQGDGVLYLDNWYREADGYCYTWFSTCGSAYDAYSVDMIDNLTSEVASLTEASPYEAYVAYVNSVYFDLSDKFDASGYGFFIFIGAFVCTLVYFVIQIMNNKGTKTTTAATYVNGGKAEFRTKEDIFLRKVVSKRKIESNQGGGGGGHVSSGGVSHGGGGGRH